jgi:uncharacterized protein YdaT
MAAPMPWTVERPPVAMRRLPPEAMRKAVEMANAMLREGMGEGQALRIAIAKARAWARLQQRMAMPDDRT